MAERTGSGGGRLLVFSRRVEVGPAQCERKVGRSVFCSTGTLPTNHSKLPKRSASGRWIINGSPSSIPRLSGSSPRSGALLSLCDPIRAWSLVFLYDTLPLGATIRKEGLTIVLLDFFRSRRLPGCGAAARDAGLRCR